MPARALYIESSLQAKISSRKVMVDEELSA